MMCHSNSLLLLHLVVLMLEFMSIILVDSGLPTIIMLAANEHLCKF